MTDGICPGRHPDVVSAHRVGDRSRRCPVTRLWVLSGRTRLERRRAFVLGQTVECPVCAPITHRTCAACFGTGWVAADHAYAVRRTL